MGSNGFLRLLISPYACLWILIDPYVCLWVLMILYWTLLVLEGLLASLWIPRDCNVSL